MQRLLWFASRHGLWLALWLLGQPSGASGFAVAPRLGTAPIALEERGSGNHTSGGPDAAPASLEDGGTRTPAAATSRRRRRTVPACPGGNASGGGGGPCRRASFFSLGHTGLALEGSMPASLMPWEALAGEVPDTTAQQGSHPGDLGGAVDHGTFLPGAVLGLRMPNMTMGQLLARPSGTLADFLHLLYVEISKAAGIGGGLRLTIAGIHGRYRRIDDKQHGRRPVHTEEEVLVVLRIAGVRQDPSSKTAVHELRAQLASPESALQLSEAGFALRNATVERTIAPGLRLAPDSDRDQVARITAMALPIGISAAFIGVLIWLAAW
mmetsp:Transcript_77596/g.240419  ORF Transcript_77596/g.240419 Transcript_77596/m.240419 type:complete len:324 (+) Transcript_77596:102-1073(+)